MSCNIPLIERLRWKLKTLESKIQNYRLSTNEYVQADTEYGKIRGQKRLTVYGDAYYSFEGIPYAQPPLGELRFKSPQRPTPWEGVRDCLAAGDKSLQLDLISDKVCGSEDCLYLNIYTNELTPETPRPVMVFIHGGGFMYGEATRDFYSPDYFIRKDVILITIQFRLNVLGFLSLGDETLGVPGNAGLKDQVLALKWIKNNCSNFGGNPDNITLFGQSAGAASAGYMMMTEQARGLFNRAIMQSGNVLCNWASKKCQPRAFQLAQLIGFKGENNDKDIFEFLSKAKAYDLIKYELKSIKPKLNTYEDIFPFGPIIEPYKTADCVLDRVLPEMIKSGWGNSIPLMVGNTSFEGLWYRGKICQKPQILDTLDTCVNYVPEDLVDGDRFSPHTLELGTFIRNIHVKDEKKVMNEFLEMVSFANFLFPMHRFLQTRFQDNAAVPVYMYRFDFDSEEPANPFRYLRCGRGIKGVGHCDDLAYLFGTFMTRRLPKDSPEFTTIERMIDIWTQFATTGNPYNNEINGLELLSWEPVKKQDQVYKCLNINNELSFIDLPEMEKIQQWNQLYEKQKK